MPRTSPPDGDHKHPDDNPRDTLGTVRTHLVPPVTDSGLQHKLGMWPVLTLPRMSQYCSYCMYRPTHQSQSHPTPGPWKCLGCRGCSRHRSDHCNHHGMYQAHTDCSHRTSAHRLQFGTVHLHSQYNAARRHYRSQCCRTSLTGTDRTWSSRAQDQA
jgi:hypothetical protein